MLTFNMNSSIAWPPLYKIKKHRLARRVKLRISKQNGLVITTPYRFNPKEIPSILEENKPWIIKHLEKSPAEVDVLPNKIILNALNEEWTIFYIASSSKIEIISRPQQELALVGKIDNEIRCKLKLRDWVKAKAMVHLTNELHRLSEKISLPFRELSIRDQKTLWGSCAADNSISLNYKLIFLPSVLVQHIMIHELCHTKHHNHSAKFWNLVTKFDTDCANNKRLLKQADQFIPTWITKIG